jgi:hypothetical protein
MSNAPVVMISSYPPRLCGIGTLLKESCPGPKAGGDKGGKLPRGGWEGGGFGRGVVG